jgi:ATP-dependent RNA helicase SUPV3L1/SUV3
VRLGPTNSGKTHDALELLATAGQGCYSAPLRMLAQEAYERLTARLGESKVGLITGEEEVNPDAAVVCCTAEMARMSGRVLVIDEGHWVADPERGWAWARLYAAAEYDQILGPLRRTSPCRAPPADRAFHFGRNSNPGCYRRHRPRDQLAHP